MPNALVAALPIALVLILMLAVRWSAVRAGVAGLALALVLAWTIFPFPSVGEDRLLGTGGALIEAAFTAASGLLGNAIAPHNLIAAAAVVGRAGRESEILRRTLPVALPLIVAAGIVALALGGR